MIWIKYKIIMSTTMLHTIFIWCVDIFIFWCAYRINRTRKIIRKESELLKMVTGSSVSLKKFIDDKINDINNRLNILSRENVRLNEENEMLREKLRNLGIKDVDLNN